MMKPNSTNSSGREPVIQARPTIVGSAQSAHFLPGWRSTGLVSALLTLGWMGLLYPLHQWAGLPFAPVDLFAWLAVALPGLVTTAGFLLTMTAALALDIQIGDALVTVGEISALLLFLLVSVLVGLGYRWLTRWLKVRPSARSGALVGAVWGLLLVMVNLAVGLEDAISARGLTGLWLWAAGWGASLGWVYGRLAGLLPQRAAVAKRSGGLTRRRFLLNVAAAVCAVTLVGGATGLQLARLRKARRLATLAATLENPPHFPATLQARIWRTPTPSTADWPFPEWAWPRYRPATHPIGVAISGGGALSMAAAVGQMRGLQALGLLDAVGAIASVSGGAWFGALFTYAPTTIDDATLLGPVRAPGALTLANLAELHPHYIAAPLADFSTERVTSVKTELMVAVARANTRPFNRVYARILNEFLLKPFGLADTQRFFTLDAATVARIIANNPGLTQANFYTTRPNRPYFITSVTQAYPLGAQQAGRSFEITPLYTGAPQRFVGEGPNGVDIGGGYVESFAFDSVTVQLQATDGSREPLVTVATPNPPFLLADLLGSTSSAPAALLTYVGEPEWFPRFHHWALPSAQNGDAAAATQAPLYSFADGAVVDAIGIVPLLRRHYPVILAFVNTQEPIDSTSLLFSKEGLTSGLTQLFGFTNPIDPLNGQRTQIFPVAEFIPLRDALRRAKAAGTAPYFMDRYTILQPNPFAIPPYPGDGKVTIVWFYNDLNQGWKAHLCPEVQALLDSREWANDMSNFPNLGVFFQNRNAAGFPELLNYTPQQINLLAHMWCYTVMQDAGETLLALANTNRRQD